jgi:hypothetical protein
MCVTSDPLAGHRARSERIRTRGSGRAEEADKIVRVRRVLPDLSFPTLPMTDLARTYKTPLTHCQ